MIHDHSRDGTGPAIASCTRQRGYLSPILCLFRLLAADHLLQAPEEVLCEIVHDDKLLHPDHLLKLAGRQWRFFRLGTRADLQSLGQSDRLEILPVSQIPLPACSRMPLPLAFRMTASLLAITKPGVRRVPLPPYPTRTFSIPKLFAHLPSLVLRPTGKPTEQAGRQQKEAGRKKWNPEWKKNGEVGQLIGGGWVNLLSAVTATLFCTTVPISSPRGQPSRDRAKSGRTGCIRSAHTPFPPRPFQSLSLRRPASPPSCFRWSRRPRCFFFGGADERDGL